MHTCYTCSMKKPLIIIALAMALIAGIISILVLTKPKSLAITPIDSTNNQTITGTHCYVYHQTATADAPYTVNEYVTMTISEGAVSGIKKGDQAGPDMTNDYTGSLTGTIVGDSIIVDYKYTVEGSQNTEREIYKLTESGMNKLQYPLIDKYKDGLVPDTTQLYTMRAYRAVVCD